MIATTDDASDRVLQVALPIIPKHIWGEETYATIGKAKFDPPLVGTGPYQAVDWQTGQFIRLQRNPNYWGTQAFQDEVDLVIYKTADTMVQALKSGELDYAHGINAEQLNALASEAEHQDGRRQRQRLDPARVQRLRRRTRARRSPTAGRRRRRCSTRPSAMPWATPSITSELVDRVLGGYGDVGTTIVPPVLTSWHVEPTTTRTFDIELAKQKLDGRRLQARRRRTPPRQGGQADHPPADDAGLRRELPQGGAVHRRLVRRAGGQRDHPGPELGRADRDHLSARRRRGLHRRLRHRAVGLERRHRPERPAARSSSATRSATRPTASTATRNSTRCTTTSWRPPTAEERKTILAEMQNLIYDKAVYDILYYDANLVGYRTDRFAGFVEPARGERHAVLHVQHAPVHQAHGRVPGHGSPVGGRVPGRAGRLGCGRGAIDRSRPRPTRTPPVRRRRSCIGLLAVVAVIAPSGVAIEPPTLEGSRRRGRRMSEDGAPRRPPQPHSPRRDRPGHPVD